MPKILFLLLFWCLGAWCTAPAAAAEEENTITWMHANFPPLRIIDGPFAGQGPSDMIHDLMRRELPDYAHKMVTANLARTLGELKIGKQVLSVGLISNPERDRAALFSLPCVVTPPIALIVRQEDLGKWPATLVEFIAKGRLGVSRSRSYGPALDAILKDFRGHDNVFVDSSDRLFENLMKMLLLKRIDGILGYPFEAMFNARMTGTAERIAILPIAESGQYVMGRVAAPRTDWGAAMIVRVNKILLRNRPEPFYRQAFLRWLPPTSHAEFNRIYDLQLLEKEPGE